MDSVISWLLEENQPAIRYLTLTGLLGKSQDNAEVRQARAASAQKGWAGDILARQRPSGFWHNDKSFSRPKYTASYWMLLILSDLGVTKDHPRISKACEIWMDRFAKNDGGFGYDTMRISEMCITASTAQAMIKFGYPVEHPLIKSAIQWILDDQKENGGWRCGWRRGIIDGWEPMQLFATIPRAQWNRRIRRAVERGAEFYLERELYKEGSPYGPWHRLHYPIHYFYDILVGLSFITELGGYSNDKRLRYAISSLKEKRRSDGRWNLEAIHPDVAGPISVFYDRRPPVPFALEKVGKPSKMITLRALKVIQSLS